MAFSDLKWVLVKQGFTQTSAAAAIMVLPAAVNVVITGKRRLRHVENSLYNMLGGEWDRRSGERRKVEHDKMREALSRIQLMIAVDEPDRELRIIRDLATDAYEFKPSEGG